MTIDPDPAEVDAVALDVLRSNLPFDLCCPYRMLERGSVGRCQLWAGHDGEHAVLFVRGGRRLVRTWLGADDPIGREDADCRTLPWARGFPLPAWHEADEPAPR